MKLNKSFLTMTFIALTAALIISPVQGASKNRKNNQGYNGSQSGTSCIIGTLPYEELTGDEEAGLVLMREEEKLARDVYAALYELWETPVFEKISQSEQRHMDSVKVLIDKYELIDPVTDTTTGIFTNSEFTDLYELLVADGNLSLIDALKVGATIEDLDIKDLQDLIVQTDNKDITLVYENLLRGSRNHLRAFVYYLSLSGETYTPQYISQDDFDEIINSDRETGNRHGRNNN